MNRKILLFAAVLLVSCAPLGRYKADNTVREDIYGSDVLGTQSEDTSILGWKQFFTDTLLHNLIQEALDSNYDLAMARENIAQAEASLTGAKMLYVPKFGFDPTAAGDYTNLNSPQYSYNLSAYASWEVDIFGKNVSKIRGAQASLEQMRDLKQATQCQVVASVAKTYYSLLQYDAQLAAAEAMVIVWRKTVETSRALKREGFADEVTVAQYEAKYADMLINALEFRRMIKAYENAMCVLLGVPYRPIARGVLAEQTLGNNFKAGIPVAMLQYRPDIKAAQKAVEAAFYTTKDAWLNFFPTLTLGGTAGLTGPFGVPVPMTFLGNLTAGLVAPVLNAGANRKALKIAESKQRQSKLTLDQTLIEAGNEVNGALFNFMTYASKEAYYTAEVESLVTARDATELVMENSQEMSYLDVLSSYSSLIQAQFDLIANQASKYSAAVDIYSSLGGGRF